MAEQIITVDDLVAQLARIYPRYEAEILTLAPSYKRVLGHLNSQTLARVYTNVIDRWDKSGPPKPAHFAAVAPTNAASTERQWWHGAGDRATVLRARVNALTEEAQRWHEQQIAEEGRGYAGAADEFADCFHFEVNRLAETCIYGTAKSGPTGDPGSLQITADIWRLAHERCASRIMLKPHAQGWKLIRDALPG